MGAITREFEFVEGSSDKFWRVTLDGADLTVTFGRRGTNGQTKTKSLASAADATKEYNSLVAEKVKKGYVEVGVAAGAAPSVASKPAASASTPKQKPAAPSAAPPAPPQPAATAPPATPVAPAEPIVAVPSAERPPYTPPSGPSWQLKHSPREAFVKAYADLDPLPRTPRPFDKGRAELERRALQQNDYRSGSPQLDIAMTPEEAWDWYHAKLHDFLVRRNKPCDYAKPATPAEVVEHLSLLENSEDGILSLVFQFLTEDQIVDEFFAPYLASLPPRFAFRYYLAGHLEEFRLSVLPFLSRPFRQRLRDALRRAADPSQGASPINIAAAILGAGDIAVQALAAAKNNDCYLADLIFAQPSPGQVLEAARRFQYGPHTEDAARDWLIHFGATQPDGLVQALVQLDGTSAKNMFSLLVAPTGSPDESLIVESVFLVYTSAKLPKESLGWLTKNRALACHGLERIASQGGKTAEEAKRLLASLTAEQTVGDVVGPALFKRLGQIALPKPIALDGVRLPEGAGWKVPVKGSFTPQTAASIPYEPLPPPERPFDREAIVKVVLGADSYAVSKAIDAFGDGKGTPEEARFLARIAASLRNDYKTRANPSDINPLWDGSPIDDSLLEKMSMWLGRDPEADLLVKMRAIGPARTARLQLRGERPHDWQKDNIILLRHLNPKERGELAAWLREFLGDGKPLAIPLSRWSPIPQKLMHIEHDSTRRWQAYLLAGMFGMHDLVDQVISLWPDGLRSSGGYWSFSGDLTMLLNYVPDDRVMHHLLRLKLPVENAMQLRRFLFRLGADAMPVLQYAIQNASSASEIAAAFDLAGECTSPGITRAIFQVSTMARARKPAKAWLAKHPVETCAVLVHDVATQGALASKAGRFLRAQRSSWALHIRAAAAAYGPEVLKRIEETVLAEGDSLTPESLWQMAAPLAKSKTKSLPGWLMLSDLPRLSVGEWTLGWEEMALVILALAESTLDAPHELIVAVREAVPVASREPFAWRLYELWDRAGGPSKEKWAYTALGLLGGDQAALKLGPLMKSWPTEGQFARAVQGLEILRTIGSDAAIQQINVIAAKAKSAALKKNATEAMDVIAEARNLTKEALEDRIIPTCGLDANGTAVFDFGTRQFTLVLDEELKVRARYPEGQVKENLPKPGAKDDAEKSASAMAQWKLAKKLVQETAKAQGQRLERAMVSGRRWTPEDFQKLFVSHPLMTNIVRRLVWGAWDEAGKLLASFRLAEDGTYANASDELLQLPDADQVGVIHPFHLPEDERAAWSQVFSDYAIVPPFPQLNRETFALTEAEKSQKSLKRFADRKIEGARLIFGLEALGWQRARAEDGGGYSSHLRYFEAQDVTAIAVYDPGTFYGATGADIEAQKIACAAIVQGQDEHSAWGETEGVVLSSVDPLVISEVIRDLKMFYDKGV